MSYPEEKQAIRELLDSFPEPHIVELGAHEGEDTEWMLEACQGKTRRFICVEADMTSYAALAAKNLQVTSLYAAIADHDGRADFYSSTECGGGYGSIYKPLNGLSVPSDKFEFHELGVPCWKFDTLFSCLPLQRIDLLYVDIHGAEKDMIVHGREALSRTRYLFVEYFHDRKYEGMATQAELLKLLPGWTMLKEFPWNMLLRNDNP